MNEREYRWELSTEGRVVGAGRLTEGDRAVLGPTGHRRDTGFVTVPWHLRLTVASGRLLAASVDEKAPACAGSSVVPKAFVEIETPCVVKTGNVEVRGFAVRAAASIAASAANHATTRRHDDEPTIAARIDEPSLTKLAASDEHVVMGGSSEVRAAGTAQRVTPSPARGVRAIRPPAPAPVGADASMMTRVGPLPMPGRTPGSGVAAARPAQVAQPARVAQEDLRETRMGASPAEFQQAQPFGAGRPGPVTPMSFARGVPTLLPHPAPQPPPYAYASSPPPFPYPSPYPHPHPHPHPNANAYPNAPPYANPTPSPDSPRPRPDTSAVSVSQPPPAEAKKRPRPAVLAIGAVALAAAGALFFASHKPAPSAKLTPAMASANPTPAPRASTAIAPTPAPTPAPAASTKAATPTAATKPAPAETHARPEKRDALAERRIAKALLAGDASAATTEADALAAAHPDVPEYRTMRRALRRMTPPTTAD